MFFTLNVLYTDYCVCPHIGAAVLTEAQTLTKQPITKRFHLILTFLSSSILFREKPYLGNCILRLARESGPKESTPVWVLEDVWENAGQQTDAV